MSSGGWALHRVRQSLKFSAIIIVRIQLQRNDFFGPVLTMMSLMILLMLVIMVLIIISMVITWLNGTALKTGDNYLEHRNLVWAQ